MLRRIFRVFWLLLLAGSTLAAFGLMWAQRSIRAIDPAIPEPAAALAFDPRADLPVKLAWLNSASQGMPRSTVLEPDVDPDPDAPYVMSHPAFVLEWADGRIFLVDLGMDQASARDFGAPIQRLYDAEPIRFHATVAELLGKDLQRVAGVAFTHLHTDHTAGLLALCEARPEALRVVQTRIQAENLNYTTRAGDAQLSQAPCARRETLDGEGVLPVPGFPGLGVLAAGGHTPGTQVFIAHVRGPDGVRTWVLTGDVVNHIDGLRLDLPKPTLYSLLLVPEATGRLRRLRHFLRDLERDHGASPLVSHDERQLRASAIPSR